MRLVSTHSHDSRCAPPHVSLLLLTIVLLPVLVLAAAAASNVPLYANILVVIGMALAFRYAAYLALRRRTRVV